jgi:hypothetical protein
MADRRQLPVEHRDDARLGRVEDQVVETVVPVHHRHLRGVAGTRGMCAGSHSISRSIASIGSVIDARYCLVQRPIWRSK